MEEKKPETMPDLWGKPVAAGGAGGTGGRSLPIRQYAVAIALLWTALLAASLSWRISQERKQVTGFAKVEAAASVQKDLVYRQWNARHGGVYAPVTEKTPPNRWLAAIENREIAAPGGKVLTLVNPAYMTRQVHEIAREQYGVRGHLTSLSPVRPQNAPDAWERAALERFAKGEKEASGVERLSGEDFYRYMTPFVTESACLKCHARQGYRLGDIRGGISVSVPMRPYHESFRREVAGEVATHLAAWLFGIALVVAGSRSFSSKVREREAAERELSETTEEMDRFFHVAVDMFCIADVKGYFRRLNPAWEKVLGYGVDELVGRRFLDYVHPDDVESTVEAVGELAAGRPVVDFTNRYRHRDGSYRWIEWRSAPYGEGLIYAGARDVTDRRRLEERLSQAQKLEAVGQLAGGVAHDFNNKLTVILGYTEMMLKQLPAGDPRREILGEVRSAGESSRDIVRQLLTFSRKQVVSPRPVDLNALVSSIERNIGRLIGENIRISFRPGEGIWTVTIDPSQVDQVLVNLAVNARDAMPDGGDLEIETANVVVPARGAGHSAGAVAGEYVRLRIRDTGSGMAPETVAHIFEPFFTTKEVGRGTGLGLATVYGVVSQNGGFIEVESEPGIGSRFDIHFPRSAAAEGEQEERAPEAPAPSPAGNGTILLVEDEESVRTMLAVMLEGIGYRVIPVASPEQAVAACGVPGNRIDIVVSDVVMPGMSGKALCDRLGEMRPGIRTLFMSGYTADVIGRHGVLEEGVHFIQKPFDLTTLHEKIRQVLENRPA